MNLRIVSGQAGAGLDPRLDLGGLRVPGATAWQDHVALWEEGCRLSERRVHQGERERALRSLVGRSLTFSSLMQLVNRHALGKDRKPRT